MQRSNVSLFVYNLPENTTDEDLIDAFKGYYGFIEAIFGYDANTNK